jgi:hypothetical protein
LPLLRSPRARRSVSVAAASILAAAGLAACGSSASTSSPSTSDAATTTKSFAATNFTTKLAGYCPSPLVVQTNWLPEPDHGALYELIGSGGTMSQYSYEGPLGSTGIKLDILSGGPGDANLNTAATLYSGNPVKRVTPQLTMDTSDSTVELSKQFPTVGVVSLQEHDPLVLISDPAKFSDLSSIAAFKAAAKKGAKFYVSGTTQGYVQYLEEEGVPASSFIGGYTGDLDRFATGEGDIINQGFADSEVYLLEHETPVWDKKVNYTYVYKLSPALNDYSELIQVKKSALKSLTPCLKRLVPLVQHAEIDYMEHPAVVNSVFEKFNPKYGASYWTTTAGYVAYSDKVMLSQDLVGNSDGGKGPVGAISISRLETSTKALLSIFAEQKVTTYQSGVTASQLATNEFIDPDIKFPAGTGS